MCAVAQCLARGRVGILLTALPETSQPHLVRHSPVPEIRWCMDARSSAASFAGTMIVGCVPIAVPAAQKFVFVTDSRDTPDPCLPLLTLLADPLLTLLIDPLLTLLLVPLDSCRWDMSG